MSQATVSYQFSETHFCYEFTNDTLIQHIRLADVQLQNKSDFDLLQVNHPLLLPVTLEWKEDELNLVSSLPMGQFFLEKKQWLTSEKIQLLMNLLSIQSLVDTDLRTFIHPKNIYLDYNHLPKLIYRGIEGKMPLSDINEEELLYQLKCLAGSLMTKYSFDDLYEGLLDESAQHSLFMKDLLAVSDFSEMNYFLAQALQKSWDEEEKRRVNVPKRRFQLFKHLTIWLSVLAIVLAIPLGYLLFKQIPVQQDCLEADTAFITTEYSKTISSLEKVKLKDLPKTQKYELAYAYVHNEGFDQQQQRNIMKNITLKSDNRYLDFWIQEGRGEFEDAVMTAKSLEDSDLISYALLQQMKSIKEDKKMKQAKKEEKLQKLQEEYKQVQDEKKGK